MRTSLAPLLLTSCVVTSTFDRYDPIARFDPANVSGTVDGLDAGDVVTLRLNGQTMQAGNGAFVFPPVIAKGSQYLVSVESSTAYECRVDHPSGVANADVADVAVHCVSADASLASLSVSTGPLSPAFDPSALDYVATARPHLPGLAIASAAVTAVPKRKDAVVVITPTSPVSFQAGQNLPVLVTVTAPDAKHSATYSITVTGAYVEDFIEVPNPQINAAFGYTVAIDADTMVAGAIGDASNATGINGAEGDTSLPAAGAAFVFVRGASGWTQQAYVKASNTRRYASFGVVTLAGDTLVVGARGETSASTGIDGDQSDTSASFAGAAYVFTRSGIAWSQQAYLKASNTRIQATFGNAVSLSNDTLVVGSAGESSNAMGVGGDQSNTSMPRAGAAYVFVRSGSAWSQQAYIKASNTTSGADFGTAVSVSGDTLAIGAPSESSAAYGAGAVYVYVRSGSTWSQQAIIRASNTRNFASFGGSVALSGDTLVVGAVGESSLGTGVDGDQTGTSQVFAGAAYVFQRTGTTWAQQAYLKPSNTPIENTTANDTPPSLSSYFGQSVAIVGDVIAVGSPGESSGSTGVNADPYDNSASSRGAIFMFSRAGVKWSPSTYVKPLEPTLAFGTSAALSQDTLVVGSEYSFWSPLVPSGLVSSGGAVHAY